MNLLVKSFGLILVYSSLISCKSRTFNNDSAQKNTGLNLHSETNRTQILKNVFDKNTSNFDNWKTISDAEVEAVKKDVTSVLKEINFLGLQHAGIVGDEFGLVKTGQILNILKRSNKGTSNLAKFHFEGDKVYFSVKEMAAIQGQKIAKIKNIFAAAAFSDKSENKTLIKELDRNPEFADALTEIDSAVPFLDLLSRVKYIVFQQNPLANNQVVRMVLILDEIEKGAFLAISAPTLIPDGSAYAYMDSGDSRIEIMPKKLPAQKLQFSTSIQKLNPDAPEARPASEFGK